MKKRKQNRICADGLHTGGSRCQVYMNGGAMSIGGTQKVVYGECRGGIGMVAEENR